MVAASLLHILTSPKSVVAGEHHKPPWMLSCLYLYRDKHLALELQQDTAGNTGHGEVNESVLKMWAGAFLLILFCFYSLCVC